MERWYYSIRLSNSKTRVICNIPPTFTTQVEFMKLNDHAIPNGSDCEKDSWERYLTKLEEVRNELISIRDRRVKYFNKKIDEYTKILENGNPIR